MSNYLATVSWHVDDSSAFIKRQYSREHQWSFDGGITVAASASPHVVPVPYSSLEAIDPEEAFVAALSSCHMLFFLDFASREKISVISYRDQAVGVMEKNQHGQIALTRVSLNPVVEYLDPIPDNSQVQRLHHRAHKNCFLANSVKTHIEVNV